MTFGLSSRNRGLTAASSPEGPNAASGVDRNSDRSEARPARGGMSYALKPSVLATT